MSKTFCENSKKQKMCWNKDVSIATYLFGLVAALVALKMKLVPWRLVMFFMTFTTIQLMEYGLWKNLEDPDANRRWSTATLFVLTAIPIMATLAIANPTVRMYAFWIALVFFAVVLASSSRGTEDTVVGADGHLQYNFFPDTQLYAIGWFFFFFLGTLASNVMYLQLFSVLSCAFSYFVVKKGGTFNSFWCYTAVAVWFFALSHGHANVKNVK